MIRKRVPSLLFAVALGAATMICAVPPALAESAQEPALQAAAQTEPKTATNVSIDSEGNLTWDNYDANAYRYWCECYFENNPYNNDYSLFDIPKSDIKVNNSKASVNIADQLALEYYNTGFESGVETNLRLRLIAVVEDNGGDNRGDSSDYSNSIRYSNSSRTRLPQPTNLVLSDNGETLSWSGFDAENTNSYLLRVFFKKDDQSKEFDKWSYQDISVNDITKTETGATANVAKQIVRAYYSEYPDGGKVKACVDLLAYADPDGTKYADSSWSAYSNTIDYESTSKSSLNAPTNVELPENYRIAWENFDARACEYKFNVKFTQNGKLVGTEYFVSDVNALKVEGTSASFYVGHMIEFFYENLKLDGEVQVTIELNAIAPYDDPTLVSSAIAESTQASYKPADEPVVPTPAVTSVKLSPLYPTVGEGEKTRLKLTINPSGADPSVIEWASSDNRIATVNSQGVVTGVKEGTAKINVNVDGKTDSVTVTVYEVSASSWSSTYGSTYTRYGLSMYRLYNPNSGEHFYTTSVDECSNVIAAGWRFENIAWKAPRYSSHPVYRLYNRNGGDHFYTMSAGERDLLVEVGWRYEGIGWYSDDAKGVAILRQYNPNAKTGSHNYTASARERDLLIDLGWRNEGVAFYGVSR